MTGGPTNAVDATVVTLAYTDERWSLTCAAVESVLGQTVLPQEIILAVDHNADLVLRLRQQWETTQRISAPRIRVIGSVYDGHQAGSATTAAEAATTEFIVFLDDDAEADPRWLASMLAPFEDPRVKAVGGAPIPVYAGPRPSWFPDEFNWVFGCAYRGLPLEQAPILHLIGTTMAVRRKDLLAIGGIHLDDFPDLELSHRLLERWPEGLLIYEPSATVRHHVPQVRLTWAYFWRRCYNVNRLKAMAIRQIGQAGHLRAETTFARHIAFGGIIAGLKESVTGDPSGILRSLAIIVGLSLSAAGFALGTLEWRWRQVLGAPHPRIR